MSILPYVGFIAETSAVVSAFVLGRMIGVSQGYARADREAMQDQAPRLDDDRYGLDSYSSAPLPGVADAVGFQRLRGDDLAQIAAEIDHIKWKSPVPTKPGKQSDDPYHGRCET